MFGCTVKDSIKNIALVHGLLTIEGYTTSYAGWRSGDQGLPRRTQRVMCSVYMMCIHAAVHRNSCVWCGQCIRCAYTPLYTDTAACGVFSAHAVHTRRCAQT